MQEEKEKEKKITLIFSNLGIILSSLFYLFQRGAKKEEGMVLPRLVF